MAGTGCRPCPTAANSSSFTSRPSSKGLGFGKRLFKSVRRDLSEHGYATLLVWALADNERALGFYSHLGGRVVRRAEERFGDETRGRIAYGFD